MADQTCLRCLPLHEAVEGMVLGAPLVLAERGVVTLRLPMGHVLSKPSLQQLAVHHAEFVCVQLEDVRTDEVRAQEITTREARLQHIFRAADFSQPMLNSLYSALLAFRKA